MSRSVAPLLIVALLGSVNAAGHEGMPDDRGRGYVPVDRVPGRALILLRDKVGLDGADALKGVAARAGVDVRFVRRVHLGWALVDVADPGAGLPDEARTLALIEKLAADPAVQSVAPDKWYRPLRVPNDPRVGDMWPLAVIDAPAAWDVTTGLASQRIGVVDTGLVRGHEDFAGRDAYGYDFVTQNGNDGDGRDAQYQDSGDACPAQGQAESSWHGTHVAGTIGAAADNGKGVAGLNWNAGLVTARALGACGGDTVDIMEAAQWLAGASISGAPSIGTNQVSVMNLSLGSTSSCSAYEQAAIDWINARGVIFVAAAGNNGGAVGSPANCTGVVTVAAHGPDLALTSYSSFGGSVEIVAPGGNDGAANGGVLSTVGPGNGYARYEGTSMAAPHVAGAISLIQALDPGLTRAEIVALLRDAGQACTGCGGVPALDLGATLAAVVPAADDPVDPPVDPPPATVDDALEENDQFGAAQPIACGATLDLFAADGDLDWFLVDVPANKALTVSIHALEGDDLDLYAATGSMIPDDFVASSQSPTGDETIMPAFAGAPLAILVAPYDDPQTGVHAEGPYRLSVACDDVVVDEPAPPPVDDDPTPPVDDPVVPPVDGPAAPPAILDDPLEDNDAPDVAKELYCGQSRDLVAGDDDWFVVHVRDGDDLAVTTTGEGTLDVRILTDAEVERATGDGAARASALSAGPYLVHVKPRDGAGAYAIAIECVGRDEPLAVGGGCTSVAGGGGASLLALLALLRAPQRRKSTTARG